MRNGLFAFAGAAIFCAVALAAPVAAQTQPAPTAPVSPAPSNPPAAMSPATEETLKTMDIAARPALVLHGAANWEEGYVKIKEAIGKLRAAAQKAGLKADAHPLAAFTDTDEAGFKFDALLPVEIAAGAKPDLSAKPDLGDGIALGKTPEGKAIKFTHTGSYDDIDTTYDAVTAYLDEKGLEATNIFLEDYLVEGKDASDQTLKVDIYVFLK